MRINLLVSCMAIVPESISTFNESYLSMGIMGIGPDITQSCQQLIGEVNAHVMLGCAIQEIRKISIIPVLGTDEETSRITERLHEGIARFNVFIANGVEIPDLQSDAVSMLLDSANIATTNCLNEQGEIAASKLKACVSTLQGLVG